MEPELITYQKFDDLALAEGLTNLLEKHNIEYALDEESFRFAPSLVLSDAPKEYSVKIKSEDFKKVNALVKEEEESQSADGIDKDYYLFSFTDDELMEVITKADEWSAFDVVLARKLLAEKGKEISDQKIEAIHQQRIEELKQPDPPQTFWVTVGYVIAFTGVVLPFFICVLGLFIGWYLSTFKKTLPDGEQVYAYDERDRRNGQRIFYISISIFVLNIVALIIYYSYFKNN